MQVGGGAGKVMVDVSIEQLSGCVGGGGSCEGTSGCQYGAVV